VIKMMFLHMQVCSVLHIMLGTLCFVVPDPKHQINPPSDFSRALQFCLSSACLWRQCIMVERQNLFAVSLRDQTAVGLGGSLYSQSHRQGCGWSCMLNWRRNQNGHFRTKCGYLTNCAQYGQCYSLEVIYLCIIWNIMINCSVKRSVVKK